MTCGGSRAGYCAGNDAGKVGDDNLLAEALSHERTEGLPGAAMYWSENYSYVTLFEADNDDSYTTLFEADKQLVFHHVVVKKKDRLLIVVQPDG